MIAKVSDTKVRKAATKAPRAVTGRFDVFVNDWERKYWVFFLD
jgi:hypothetical protein